MYFIGIIQEKEEFRAAVVYRAPSGFVNLDSARQSQIEAPAFRTTSPAPSGQGEKKDRFGKVVASPNSQNLTERGIRTDKKTIAIETFAPGNVKLFYNLPPFHTGKEVQIVSGLSGADLFVRKIHLPLTEKRKILAALPFQMETLIPFPAEQAVICLGLKGLSKQMTSVSILATVKDTLNAHLSSFQSLGIQPDVVSCYPAALVRFAKWQFPNESRILSFHIAEEKILCVLSEAGELVLSQTLHFEDPALELNKLSIFLKQKGAVDEQTPWLMTGNADFSETIQQFFQGPRLNVNYADYAIPIGLALDALASDESSVQFCQGEFTPERTEKVRQRRTLTYLGFCLGSALLMAVGSSFLISKKQNLLIERLNQYHPSKTALSSHDQIRGQLLEWETSLNKNKTSFAFLPTAPKVSDALAWISTHAALTAEDGSQKEGIDIKSLHYQLVKYPKIGEASSPYIAQLELEFASETPRAARDFHEMLLKGDPIVNGKKEIKWQAQHPTYRTSFELKP